MLLFRMRRVSMMFDSENHGNDNAVRRYFLQENEHFYPELAKKTRIGWIRHPSNTSLHNVILFLNRMVSFY